MTLARAGATGGSVNTGCIGKHTQNRPHFSCTFHTINSHFFPQACTNFLLPAPFLLLLFPLPQPALRQLSDLLFVPAMQLQLPLQLLPTLLLC